MVTISRLWISRVQQLAGSQKIGPCRFSTGSYQFINDPTPDVQLSNLSTSPVPKGFRSPVEEFYWMIGTLFLQEHLLEVTKNAMWANASLDEVRNNILDAIEKKGVKGYAEVLTVSSNQLWNRIVVCDQLIEGFKKNEPKKAEKERIRLEAAHFILQFRKYAEHPLVKASFDDIWNGFHQDKKRNCLDKVYARAEAIIASAAKIKD